MNAEPELPTWNLARSRLDSVLADELPEIQKDRIEQGEEWAIEKDVLDDFGAVLYLSNTRTGLHALVILARRDHAGKWVESSSYGFPWVSGLEGPGKADGVFLEFNHSWSPAGGTTGVHILCGDATVEVDEVRTQLNDQVRSKVPSPIGSFLILIKGPSSDDPVILSALAKGETLEAINLREESPLDQPAVRIIDRIE